MVRIGSFYLSFKVWLHLKVLALFVTNIKSCHPQKVSGGRGDTRTAAHISAK